MKATDLKCPKCGAVPTSSSWEWTLVEPATAYRRLAISVAKNGEVTQITSNDVEHDDGDGESFLSHRGCTTFKIPKGFGDFDIYG